MLLVPCSWWKTCGLYWFRRNRRNWIPKYIADPRFLSLLRADFLIMSEFQEPGSFKRQMDHVPYTQQFELIRGLYWDFVVLGGHPPIRSYALIYGDSILRSSPVNKNDPNELMERLKALNILVTASSHFLYSYQHVRVESGLKNSTDEIREILLSVFDQQFDLKTLSIPAINDALENALNFNSLSKQDVQLLLNKISPYEGRPGNNNFLRYYPVDKQVQYSGLDQFKHNGGYQELAYLYATLGDLANVKSCVDSLLKYHSSYATFRTNILNISTYLFKEGYARETDELLSYYAEKQRTSKKELYETWLNSSGFLELPIVSKANSSQNLSNQFFFN